MSDIKINERLWLSKEDGIYVDHCQLPQHQIDAIRFLYAQFKKKKPGVIVNDPPGYGKTLEVVLFLNAIRRVLVEPALVLVKDNELPVWREHFQLWSQFKDDVIYDSSNPYVKKAVFVSTRQHAASLARRSSWAVAVVDCDCAHDRPSAAFKIWLTSVDMKDNLHTFASVYKWLYPEGEFDAKEYSTDKSAAKSTLSKALQLDAFFEDILIRGRDFTPFKKPELVSAMEPPRITRKNKDATGTKIKRSKPRPEPAASPKVPRVESPERNATITSKDYYKDRGLDVESFIRDKKPIECEEAEEFLTFEPRKSDAGSPTRDTTKQSTDSLKLNGGRVNIPVNEASETACENSTDTNSADYRDAINDIVLNENDKGERLNDSLVENETIRDVVSSSKKDLDSKIQELEEKTLNKFKGSLLDSIF